MEEVRIPPWKQNKHIGKLRDYFSILSSSEMVTLRRKLFMELSAPPVCVSEALWLKWNPLVQSNTASCAHSAASMEEPAELNRCSLIHQGFQCSNKMVIETRLIAALHNA